MLLREFQTRLLVNKRVSQGHSTPAGLQSVSTLLCGDGGRLALRPRGGGDRRHRDVRAQPTDTYEPGGGSLLVGPAADDPIWPAARARRPTSPAGSDQLMRLGHSDLALPLRTCRGPGSACGAGPGAAGRHDSLPVAEHGRDRRAEQ